MGQQNARMNRLKNRISSCHSTQALRDLVLSEDSSAENINVNCFINTDDYDHVTPLWLAVRYQDVELTQALISYGAELNVPCYSLKMVPLHMATYKHSIELTRILLENGADPNTIDRWNYTPLMFAAIHFDPFIVQELFQALVLHEADVNFGATLLNKEDADTDFNMDIPDLNSQFNGSYITYIREPMGPTSGTALHLAAQNPHLSNENIELLLAAGAQIDMPNLNGQTPLMGIMMDIYYDYHSNSKAHAELLISKGASIDVQDNNGWTCFHYAAHRGSINCMSLLLNAGANCDILSILGVSPLWLALIRGWEEASTYLIRNRCDVNLTLRAQTILQINSNIEIFRLGSLLPIEFAVSNRHFSTAELLIRVGCGINPGVPFAVLSNSSSRRYLQFLEFLDIALRERRNVRALVDLCRECIRCAMKQGVCVKVAKLVLPEPLKDFICFR